MSSWAETPDPLAGKVRALASPRYAVREKAACELEEAGEAALPALELARKSADPDLRERAESVAKRIERKVLSKQLLVAPKLRIKLDSVPLHEAISVVAKQTGIRYSFEPGPGANLSKPITLDTGELPYWQAIQAFYEATGIAETDAPIVEKKQPQTPQDIRGGRRARTLPGALNQVTRLTTGKQVCPAACSEGLRVRMVDSGYPANRFDPAKGELTFHLDVDAANGIEVREIIGIEIRSVKAADRRKLACAYPLPNLPYGGIYGEQLLLAKQVIVFDGEFTVNNGTPEEANFPVTLKIGNEKPKMLEELRGIVVASVLTPPEPLITLKDVFQRKPEGQTKNGLSLSVTSSEQSKPNEGTLRVSMESKGVSVNEILNFPVQVRGRARPFIRINRQGGLSARGGTEFRALDAEGKPLKIVSSRNRSTSSDGIRIIQDVELKLEKPAAGWEGVSISIYGRRPVEVDMPFVLRDVPMP